MESVTAGQDSRNILVQHSCYDIDSTAVACLQKCVPKNFLCCYGDANFYATLLVQTTQM